MGFSVADSGTLQVLALHLHPPHHLFIDYTILRPIVGFCPKARVLLDIPAGAVVSLADSVGSVGVSLAQWDGRPVYVFREDVMRDATLAARDWVESVEEWSEKPQFDPAPRFKANVKIKRPAWPDLLAIHYPVEAIAGTRTRISNGPSRTIITI